MCYHLKTEFGGTEAVIDDNCGISKFYSIAEVLSDELRVTFLSQIDDAEVISWDFKYKKHLLALQYNIFNGVSILPLRVKDPRKVNKAVEELANHLVKRAF